MNNKSYQIHFLVDQTPTEAFNAVNEVSKWWTENIEGPTKKLNDEFTVRFGDVHMSKQKLVEFNPDEKVVWLITDSNLNFVKDKSEWTNTKIHFDLSEKDGRTHLIFTHEGLTPTLECFNGCTNAWDMFIKKSLFRLITEGKGLPEKK